MLAKRWQKKQTVAHDHLMTARIKNSVNHFGLIFLVLVTTLFMTTGCGAWLMGSHQPDRYAPPDPLAGWNILFSHDYEKLDKAITEDYQNYIEKLPNGEGKFVGPIQFFADETGQHAVRIEIALNGTDWAHVLIYDEENKRVKVIKYVSGHYRS
jgi:hypothetical protein